MTATKRSTPPPSTDPAAQESRVGTATTDRGRSYAADTDMPTTCSTTSPTPVQIGDWPMMRRMLLGIRERAEGTPPRTDHPARLPDTWSR